MSSVEFFNFKYPSTVPSSNTCLKKTGSSWLCFAARWDVQPSLTNRACLYISSSFYRGGEVTHERTKKRLPYRSSSHRQRSAGHFAAQCGSFLFDLHVLLSSLQVERPHNYALALFIARTSFALLLLRFFPFDLTCLYLHELTGREEGEWPDEEQRLLLSTYINTAMSVLCLSSILLTRENCTRETATMENDDKAFVSEIKKEFWYRISFEIILVEGQWNAIHGENSVRQSLFLHKFSLFIELFFILVWLFNG